MEGLLSDLPEQNGQLEHGIATLDTAGATEPGYASSISFSSPGHSEPDSDFATDGFGRVTGQKRRGSSDDEGSDDSTYGAKKRWQLISCAEFALACAASGAAQYSHTLQKFSLAVCSCQSSMNCIYIV